MKIFFTSSSKTAFNLRNRGLKFMIGVIEPVEVSTYEFPD